MRCFALQYAGRATVLQSAVVSLDRLKQDKNVGPKSADRFQTSASNGSDSRSSKTA